MDDNVTLWDGGMVMPCSCLFIYITSPFLQKKKKKTTVLFNYISKPGKYGFTIYDELHYINTCSKTHIAQHNAVKGKKGGNNHVKREVPHQTHIEIKIS